MTAEPPASWLWSFETADDTKTGRLERSMGRGGYEREARCLDIGRDRYSSGERLCGDTCAYYLRVW